MTVAKISSLDVGYSLGDLSLFPLSYDSKSDLYIAANNCETKLKHALSFSGQKVIVEDGSQFPQKGILRIGTAPGEVGGHELIYYSERTDTVFSGLIRGFCNTRRSRWESNSPVTSGVMAEHNNALRDAIYNIETDLGTQILPATNSLNDLLQKLEEKWLAPRALFRVTPSPIGPAPLFVRFQNFTLAHSVRYFWDFGDGTTSVEKSPIHVYRNEGRYTVRLDVITRLGGTGVTTKYDYIIVDNEQVVPFFYVEADEATPGNISVETAAARTLQTGTYVPPTKFNFIDQTDGNILQRYWVFDDGDSAQVIDPNIHIYNHYYQKPGIYNPSELIVFSSTLLKRGFLQKKVVVV